MSGSSTPRGAASQPKQISSRLLNMKFMQRAEATNKNKSQSQPPTPSSERPLKRRRTGDIPTPKDVPTTPTSVLNTPTYADRTSISGALRAEADGSSVTRGRNHFDDNTFETEWVLNIALPPIANNSNQNGQGRSFDDHDDNEEAEEEEESSEDEVWGNSNPRGRQTYGSLKKKKKSQDTNNISTPSIDKIRSQRHSAQTSTSKSAKRNHDSATSSTKATKKKKNPFGDPATSNPNSDDLDSGQDSDLNSSDPSDNNEEDESEEDNNESDIEASQSLSSSSENESEDPSSPAEGPKKSTIDFTSEEYLRKMDEMAFSKAGAGQGLGRQRMGLGQGQAGGGGGGGKISTTPKNRSHLVGQKTNHSSHGKGKKGAGAGAGGGGRFSQHNKKRKTM